MPVEDPPALAEAMTKLAASPELRRRLGAAGAARVREHFSWDGMVDAYFRLYARFQEGLGAAAAAGSGVR